MIFIIIEVATNDQRINTLNSIDKIQIFFQIVRHTFCTPTLFDPFLCFKIHPVFRLFCIIKYCNSNLCPMLFELNFYAKKMIKKN